jgi:peptidoglycan/xylan/chitin deacetylase (PgdA/CDA1 family)
MSGRVLTRSLLFVGLLIYYLRGARLIRWIGRRSPKVLLYHDFAEVENDYVAGLNSTTTPQRFAQHLDYLCAHYRVVELKDITSGTAPSNSVAITFDDGYRSVYTSAYPQLRSRKLPATVYLISEVVDNKYLVWVNELNFLLRRGGERATREACQILNVAPILTPSDIVDHCRLNYDNRKISGLIEQLRVSMPVATSEAEVTALYLSQEEIEEMSANRISFGNHTRTHPNLERLTEEEQAEEIEGAQRALSGLTAFEPTLAYPFGHHSSTTAKIAARYGLLSVAEVGGFNRRDRPERVGRVHLSVEHQAGLFAKMEIVEPVKGLLRDMADRSRRGRKLAR